jgi:hypothetical protein
MCLRGIFLCAKYGVPALMQAGGRAESGKGWAQPVENGV